MADFLDGPESYTFPLWKGQDTSFSVKRKDPETGNYINYDTGTVAKIVFTSNNVDYEFTATIAGHEAAFSINDDDVINVRTGATWRLQFTVGGKDKAPVVGKVVRKDAK